jgi:hypothetical protein
MPMYYDYNNPSVPFIVNSRNQPTSQRLLVGIVSVQYITAPV